MSTALQLPGFGRIDHADRFESLCEAIHRGRFDLMVSEALPARGNICKLVKKVRHGTFGCNPFPGIIMITARPERKSVLRAKNSGPDHLIRWPFTSAQIGARIKAIVDHRKPLLVTFDYIGRLYRATISGRTGATIPGAATASRGGCAMPATTCRARVSSFCGAPAWRFTFRSNRRRTAPYRSIFHPPPP